MKSVYDKLSESVSENGRIVFNGKDVSMRDAAFMCYYLIKKGNYDKVFSFIDNTTEKIKAGNVCFDGMVLWLWLLGEYFNETKEIEKLKGFSDIVDFCIDYISGQWQKPGSNWLDIFDEGIYISNIAMSFGAIQSINNTIKSEKAQKLLLSMREFMFKKFLDEGKVVSKLGDNEIFGDISPFGLLDAGNQILVQSINVLEKELVTKGVRFSNRDMFYGGCTRTCLTCLLSWYYSERGEISRAKRLLEQVDELLVKDGRLNIVDLESSKENLYRDYFLACNGGNVDESYLSYVLYAIADNNINSKQRSSHESTESIKTIHNPKGSENRYMNVNIGRCPYNPLSNDDVILKMITQPFDSNQKIRVEYSVNGNVLKNADMHLESSDEGEKYWEAGIGTFDFGDFVEYRFIVAADSVQTISETYSFSVMAWKPVGKITQICNTEEGLNVYFDHPINGFTGRPCIKFKKYDVRSVKCTFNIETAPQAEAIDKIASDSYNIKFAGKKLEVGLKDFNFNISDEASGKICKSYDRHGSSFIEILTDAGGRIHKVNCKFLIDAGERFFGMGERYSHTEYRGLEIDNYVYNQYTHQKLKTYIPVPLAISTGGYGIFADTTMYSIFKFGTRLSDLFEIEIDIHPNKQCFDMFLFTGDPKDILKSFSDITGKPKLPPMWAFGLWMSSNNWDNQAETYKQVELTKKYEIPSTVLVLEQWSDEATYYIFNDAQYQVKDGCDYLKYEDFTFPEWGRWPDPKKMVNDLHKEGIKLLLWQIPVQKYMDGVAHAQRDEDEKSMLENGYYIKYKDGKPYRIPDYEWFRRSLVPDFSNPAAREWWFNKRLYFLKDLGIDGFKTDGGECIYGDDLLFFDGRTGDEMRNQYPNDYIASYQDLMRQYVRDGGVTFSRAGYTGAQNWPIHWAGDEGSTFDAFRASVRAGLSCGMSGISMWGWDLAGFHGKIPTAELFIRSAQMAVFCPIMQYHTETKSEFNNDRTPWNIAERTGNPYVIDIFKQYTDLRMNLIPYIYQQAVESSRTGIPIMRSMFMEYPDDQSCIELDGQYFFGESLLVAPILEEGSCVKDVYFPHGEWENLFTGERISGSRYVKVKADIRTIPVYIKENSVIPLNLPDSLKLFGSVGNNPECYDRLCFAVSVADSLDYLFEDHKGNRIRIVASKEADALKLSLETHCSEDFTLIISKTSNEGKVLLNGKLLSINDISNPGVGEYAVDGGHIAIRCINADIIM